MASYLKQKFYEHRERKYLEPSFRSYSDMSTEAITGPMENSFIHINGTSQDIIDRSKTIVTVRHQQLAEEDDCIIVNNSKFYSTVPTTDRDAALSGEEFPDGTRSKNPTPALNLDLSFRDTVLRKPVRGISVDMEDLSLDLDTPDIDFNHSRLTLQKSVAEKYKLGNLVEEMDDRFFEMTEEEKKFHYSNKIQNKNIITSNSIEISNRSEGDQIQVLRTPPPPPKPYRKNSQKRNDQKHDVAKESSENSDMEFI